MLYIKIPDGMRFEVLNKVETKNGVDVETQEDYFVPDDDNDKAPISVQALVKTFYSSHKDHGVVNGVECYKRKPAISASILVYRANKNGTCPSDRVMMCNTAATNTPQNSPSSRSSSSPSAAWWANGAFLSEKRREALEKKRDEQRADRRHYGNSPKAT